jgi:hypothetical protein
MPKTSSVDKLLADTGGFGMATTAVGFKPDDCVAVLEALNIRKMPRIWSCGDMMVLLVSGHAGQVCRTLQAQGISFNYATYPVKDSMHANQAGQVRYGHDGTDMNTNLVPDPQLAAIYNRSLPGESAMDDVTRFRICHVCCGQEPWDDREANGQMHKLRALLSQ